MNIHNNSLKFKLNVFEQFNKLISDGDIEKALTFFLANYEVLVNKDSLSLQLAELIYKESFVPHTQPQWPPTIFNSHSGSLLVFLIAQLTNKDVPIELMTVVSNKAPKKLRKLFSEVWLIRPECSF